MIKKITITFFLSLTALFTIGAIAVFIDLYLSAKKNRRATNFPSGLAISSILGKRNRYI